MAATGYQGRSHFRPHIVESYVETYKNRDHMQVVGKSKKMSEISKFRKIEISQHLEGTKMVITHSILKIQVSYFGFSPFLYVL